MDWKRGTIAALTAAWIAACGSSRTEPTPAPTAASPPTSASDGWVGEPDPSLAPPAPPVAPASAVGRDFAEEARALFRVAACAGEGPVPAYLDARIVDGHCRDLKPKLDAYRARYVGVARPFLAALAPPGLPAAVVYPFAGGDLVTALTTFPDAREITTISLELAGDPRRIRSMTPAALDRSLRQLRAELLELIFLDDYSRSETLKRTQRGDIPGELAFFLVALAVHGFEPVSLRYFRLDEGGAVHYLTAEEIDAVENTTAPHRKGTWTPPDFSEAFANAELTFRPAGGSEPSRVHRHIAANLADVNLALEPSLLRHLTAKGRVAAMTKAASYLLWQNSFSRIRDYLLGHMDFMVSDSTGIPPQLAEDAGFSQETYGTFKGSLLGASDTYNAAFRKLWDGQPRRKLPFRYGYLDTAKAVHLLVTRRVPAAGAGGGQSK